VLGKTVKSILSPMKAVLFFPNKLTLFGTRRVGAKPRVDDSTKFLLP